MNKKNKKLICGFTIIEVMLVVLLIGVLAAFAIPNYQKVVAKGVERRAYSIILMISGAVEVYRARNGDYPQQDLWNLDEINNVLGINAQDDKVLYVYRPNTGGLFSVRAYPNDYTWNIHRHTDPSIHIHCSVVPATCPSCKNLSDGGCPY